jgi:tRNA A37 threonylcarbamoyladenosine biosynthesis protein TsaE
MNKISDPQYGDNFVGRGEEINELKEKIENNGIVVITGDRGIGKTNLTLVVEKAKFPLLCTQNRLNTPQRSR